MDRLDKVFQSSMGLVLAVFSYPVSAQQNVDPNYSDKYPLGAYGDQVSDPDASFYYLSDIEDVGDPVSSSILWVRNVHASEGLIFEWHPPNNGVPVIRNAANPLPSGAFHKARRDVCGYENLPATNTEIYYTQSARGPIIASAYITYPCGHRYRSCLTSEIETAFRSDDKEVRIFSFSISSSISESEIHYEVVKDVIESPVAVGSLWNSLVSLQSEEAALDVLKAINSTAANSGVSVKQVPFADFVGPDNGFELERIPDSLLEDTMLLFEPTTGDGFKQVSWSIPITGASDVVYAGVPVALFQPSGELLTTGEVAVFLPGK